MHAPPQDHGLAAGCVDAVGDDGDMFVFNSYSNRVRCKSCISFGVNPSASLIVRVSYCYCACAYEGEARFSTG